MKLLLEDNISDQLDFDMYNNEIAEYFIKIADISDIPNFPSDLDWVFTKRNGNANLICECNIPCVIRNIACADDEYYFEGSIKGNINATILEIRVILNSHPNLYLSDDAIEFYEDLFGADIYTASHYSIYDFDDEIGIEDIDFDKVNKNVEKELYDFSYQVLYPNDEKFLKDLTYEGGNLDVRIKIKLDNKILDKYILYASQGWNYFYTVIYNGKEIRRLEEVNGRNYGTARAFLEDYINDIIQEGKEKEINWEECYVVCSTWKVTSSGEEQIANYQTLYAYNFPKLQSVAYKYIMYPNELSEEGE